MKFSGTMKGRELTVIIKLLTIFGVVEQRQLRLLFDYMPTNAYGKVLSHLKREGLAYFSVDGRYDIKGSSDVLIDTMMQTIRRMRR